MRALRVGMCCSLVLAVWLACGASAWAAPAYVQGNYVGKAMLTKEGEAPKDKAQMTTVKAELKQAGDKITGSLIVGDKPDDLIVLEITSGEVQDDFIWFQGEEMIWRCQFSGNFKNNEISGTIMFLNHNPAEKLLPKDQVKSFQPVKLRGPLDMTRR
ncbi:hypothetical protein [Desulfoferula mesophila]|uniref:Lipoprotein n=1 Tax=Desulfoferula mesophila TaxID=3058419 RepID=A0AAU9ENW9_9BACT|nr:hypothetical protein FAK_19400 [Desulfoferula mesophilus]